MADSGAEAPPVRYQVDARVARLTLDSPRNRNALSRALVGQLFERLDEAAADDAVQVVVIAGAGPGFCSGADLSEAAEGGMEQGAWALVELQRRILALGKPVVTRLHGAVRAGGIGIVAASDIAIAAEDATFALTEVRLGLAPAVISLTVLPRLTSRAAAWACLGGEVFTGADAVGMGLVTRAVPAEQLDAAVDAVCEALLRGAPQGLRETKALLTGELLDRIDARGEQMAAVSARLFGSEAAREAMLAFLSRPPR